MDAVHSLSFRGVRPDTAFAASPDTALVFALPYFFLLGVFCLFVLSILVEPLTRHGFAVDVASLYSFVTSLSSALYLRHLLFG
jgi:hypothetical protein